MSDTGRASLLWVALLWIVAIPSAVVFAPTCDLIVYNVVGNTNLGSGTFSIHATEAYSSLVNQIRTSQRLALPIPKDYEPWFEFFAITTCVLVFSTALFAGIDTFFNSKDSLVRDAATTTAWLGVISTVLWTTFAVDYASANSLATGQDVEVGSCALVCAGISAIGSQLVLFLGRRTQSS